MVITSHSLEKCPLVRTVVMIEDPLYPQTDTAGLRSDVEVVTFKLVVQKGVDNPAPPNAPSKEDLAIIMYTTGSTGVLKGVTATTNLFLHKFDNTSDVYLAYLH